MSVAVNTIYRKDWNIMKALSKRARKSKHDDLCEWSNYGKVELAPRLDTVAFILELGRRPSNELLDRCRDALAHMITTADTCECFRSEVAA